MADTTTTKISDEQQDRPTNSIISIVLQLVKPPPSKKIEPTAATSDPKPTASVEQVDNKPPDVVKFPSQDISSLKLESEGVSESNTNPVVLWQVYAIGAFFVVRWAWSKWNESRGKRKPSDEEPPGQE
ncbi:unnamed protein product [Withania somnifera]